MTRTPADQRICDALAELQGADAKAQRPGSLSFHPFPARMPCAVAEHLIERITQPGATVLDPMVGSGTTLIAARRLGRHSNGFDRDPLAVLVSRATTQSIASEQIVGLESRVLKRARVKFEKSHLPQIRERLPEEDQKFLRYWFPWRSQKELFALAAAIEREPEGPGRDLAWAVLSSLVIAKSAGASFALDISRSRPHKSTEKPIVLPFDGWSRRFRSAIARHPFVDTIPTAKATVRLGDARSLPLEEDVVDLVLTSPPYLNAVDYLRAHKFSLIWMGHDLESLRELRGTMMGAERGLWSRDGLPHVIEEQFEEMAIPGRRRAFLRKYVSDLRKVLAEAKRVLRPGGVVVLLVGPTIIATEEPDAIGVVTKLGSSLGLELVGSAVRRLSPWRRSLPPPSQLQGNPLGKRMQNEILVALRK